ncbi:MAG TPA: DUF4349 domain-containing protein [Solirubrobacteraceae bacterium]|nr:DUF4349 domain-containing protein [Solirubrobacteraceae bacterium]
MRWTDDEPLTPEVAGALMAIDATLEGDPVDPEYADLAELALILRADRPEPSAALAAGLDERVARRFRPPERADARRRWNWPYAPAAAVAALGVCVALVVVVAGNVGGSSSGSSQAVFSSSSAAAGAAAAPARKAPPFGTLHRSAASPAAHGAASASSSASSAPSASAAPGSPAPSPGSTGGRQIVQSAQVQLSTAPSRIDDVAQQVFDVVGQESGIVSSSSVTATGNVDGNAVFKLSIPSANLSATLNALSRLHGANVLSRTDATNDITGQVGGAGQRLAEARALRTSLLKQLAAATTTEQVDSIKAQLRGADASIASDLSTLRGLKRQVAYSNVVVGIQAMTPPPPVSKGGGGFTLGRAAHDAGRVLVVVAGVALIALAVLVPLGLVAALVAWVGLAVRRRRREQALDLV